MQKTIVVFLAVACVTLFPALGSAEDGPTLHEIKVGTDVDRETKVVAGEATSFAGPAEKVCAYIELRNIGDEKTVVFKWYLGDHNSDNIEHTVRGWRWRTWTCKTNLEAGDWKVDIVLQQGEQVLGTKTFTVTAPAGQ